MRQDGLALHAWVLMSNRYHLFVKAPRANLVEGIGRASLHVPA
jgi:hypothetical protein